MCTYLSIQHFCQDLIYSHAMCWSMLVSYLRNGIVSQKYVTFLVSFVESEIRPARLLTWCQKQTEGYRNVTITDLTSSWKSGIALCALIHRFKPQLMYVTHIR